jgi:phosphoribosylformylglycinamidine synthase II
MPDSRGDAACREARSLGLHDAPQHVTSANVYLLEGELDQMQVRELADDLLADPVTEEAVIGSSPVKASAVIEVHPLPGVMDPDAEAVQLAIKAMLGRDVSVRTGRRYDMECTDRATARTIAERLLANTVIHAIHEQPYHPAQFAHGTPYELKVNSVPLRDLDDAALVKMSREAHLFLSLDEMKAIQSHFRTLERDPREIELETLAQTWSEHCVHKTLKATIRYREAVVDARRPRIAMRGRPGHEANSDGSVTIHNLLKSTVAAATHELIKDGIDWCLSVFVDNSGVIAFDDQHAVCFKVETHNHPSAIEPYGGAATGIGGCIRDIIGTGLGAKPIAATDVFCVAFPNSFTTENTGNTEGDTGSESSAQSSIQNGKSKIQNAPPVSSVNSVVSPLPQGCLPPRRILTQVVAGVRDYGNRMGIPTLNGAVWFDDDYVGNPLVFCGVIGVMPRDKIKGHARKGDRIIAIGGRTGRDGIHGATFSSAELTDTHADEFSHAVQIGNAVTEKMMLDAILEARDVDSGPLYTAITDCGAGGFSSAVGEMGKGLGAEVHLDRAPLKYAGLSPTEIWISEAQERMVLAAPPENVAALQSICERHNVEMCDLGSFGTETGELILNYKGTEVGRLSMEFLHEGLPEVVRDAVWDEPASRGVLAPVERQRAAGMHRRGGGPPSSIEDALLALLAHPNIASKRWIIRQYDHEVQGGTVVKPISGVQEGPSDAAVITPVLGSMRGLAIANGLATGLKDDPYLMTLAAIDECVRNLVCVGADPSRIAILDNFCWPSCNDPQSLGALVRAAEGCYDGAKAYRTPFISGKDSLNNQFTTEDGRTIRIPPTLLISGMGIVDDIRKCVTMDAKAAGNLLILVGETDARMEGSHYEMVFGGAAGRELPAVDLESGPRTALAVAQAIANGLVRSAHDCSEGGLLVAAAEMAIAGDLGVRLDLGMLPTDGGEISTPTKCFAETPSRYLLEIERQNLDRVDALLRGVPYAIIGEFHSSRRLTLMGAAVDVPIEDVRSCWLGTLNW